MQDNKKSDVLQISSTSLFDIIFDIIIVLILDMYFIRNNYFVSLMISSKKSG